jgi:hypothetical protein
MAPSAAPPPPLSVPIPIVRPASVLASLPPPHPTATPSLPPVGNLPPLPPLFTGRVFRPVSTTSAQSPLMHFSSTPTPPSVSPSRSMTPLTLLLQRPMSPTTTLVPSSKARRSDGTACVPDVTARAEVLTATPPPDLAYFFAGTPSSSTVSSTILRTASSRRPFSRWTLQNYKDAAESQRCFFWQRASEELKAKVSLDLSQDPSATALWEKAVKEYFAPQPVPTSAPPSTTTPSVPPPVGTTVTTTTTTSTVFGKVSSGAPSAGARPSL